MTRRPRLATFLLICTIMAGIAATFWIGLIPARYIPFATLDLTQKDAWFLDLRLAALKSDSALCQAVLSEPNITATPVSNQPYQSGCGWTNAVRISNVGGARLSAAQLTCPMSAALAMWVTHGVQPEAERLLGQKVVAIRHMGTYACRNIVGSRRLKSFRSQHATANAIDISGFILADGTQINVLADWPTSTVRSSFLKAVKDTSCRYFRVSIGPEFNEAHANHFHFDRGSFKTCR